MSGRPPPIAQYAMLVPSGLAANRTAGASITAPQYVGIDLDETERHIHEPGGRADYGLAN
jgi:hypothetical protein